MWALPAMLSLSAAPAIAGPRNINPGDPIGALKLTALDGASVDSSTWSGRPSVWLFISPQQNSSERAMIALQKIVDDTPPPGLAAVALTTDAVARWYTDEFIKRLGLNKPGEPPNQNNPGED